MWWGIILTDALPTIDLLGVQRTGSPHCQLHRDHLCCDWHVFSQNALYFCGAKQKMVMSNEYHNRKEIKTEVMVVGGAG